MEINRMVFDVSSDRIKLKKLSKEQFIGIEIWAISTANPNRNGSYFTPESLEVSLPSVYDKPILGCFEKITNDFNSHDGEWKQDSDGINFWDNKETPLGVIRSTDKVEIVEKDGLQWLVINAVLWCQYNWRQIKKIFKDKKKKVSVEVNQIDYYTNDEGIEVIDKFELCGITILGSRVLEGIEGAHLSLLDSIDKTVYSKQKEKLCFAYKQFDGKTEDSDINKEEDSIKMENFAYKIKVNKSKEAISDKEWGEVDKTELAHKVVEADNFEEVAGDIYLRLDEGWKDKEVSKLSYPVMELKGNKEEGYEAVYNINGLRAAYAYANREEGGDPEVVEKIEKIYKDLDLELGNNEKRSNESSEDIKIQTKDEKQPEMEAEGEKTSIKNINDQILNEEFKQSHFDEDDENHKEEDDHDEDDHEDDEHDEEPEGDEGHKDGKDEEDHEEDEDDHEEHEDHSKVETPVDEHKGEKCEECEHLKMQCEELQHLCESYKEKCIGFEENVKELQETCKTMEECKHNLEELSVAYNELKEQYEGKCSECEELKKDLDEAKKVIRKNECEGFILLSKDLFKCAGLSKEQEEEILHNCEAGEYCNEAEVETAIAVYSFKNAQKRNLNKTDHMSFTAPLQSLYGLKTEEKTEKKSAQERLNEYVAKRN